MGAATEGFEIMFGGGGLSDPGAPILEKPLSAQSKIVAMKIQEGLADYTEYLAQIEAAGTEQVSEGIRKGMQTRAEGIAAIGEMSRQAAYETKTAYMGAELTSSAQEAKLGASGVRATGSPLLAAQQMSDVAWGAAGEKGRAGAAGITLGGLKLGGSLADIRAQTTLLTSEYQRKLTSARRKKTELETNAPEMIRQANLGAIIDWTKFAIGSALSFL